MKSMGKAEHTADSVHGCAHIAAHGQEPRQSAQYSRVPKSNGPLPAGWWMVPGAIIGMFVWGAIAWFLLRACNFC